MRVNRLLSALLAWGILACAVTWAAERSAKSGGAKDVICLAGLIQDDPRESGAEEPSRPLPPPPPMLRRLADPGYSAIDDNQAASPFVEEKSPPRPATPDDGAAGPPRAKDAPKAPPVPNAAATPQTQCQCPCPCPCPEELPQQWRLFDWPRLDAHRIEINGWLDQGMTLNGYNPVNRYNGPVTFNDRANEYQMNQFYVYAERKADTSQHRWDWGGRVDLLYGTDYRFTTAQGLEDGVNDGARFYGLAAPQFYLDLAKDDLTIRVGHFYSILGYESVPAPNNFFYSHSYTMQYALPFTHTGVMSIRKLNDNWTITAGIHRGWDTFSDGNASVLAGLNWTSCDQRTTGAFAITSGKESVSDNTRTAYDLYVTRKLGQRFTYVFEHSLGTESNGAGAGRNANWYSIVNYLFYKLNDRWEFGARYEWFGDEEGVRVRGIGDPTSAEPIGFVYPQAPATAHRSDWGELSLGVNYKPNRNFILRSEVRWDWQIPRDPGAQSAFNDYHELTQTLWANDVIFKF